MKRIKKDAVLAQSNWHPNFRIADSLPDLKVVRTDFFINAISPPEEVQIALAPEPDTE